MKKLFSTIVLVVLISLWACEKENVSLDQTDLVEESSIDQIEEKGHWGQRCFYFIEYGQRVGRRCYSFLPGICDYKVICIPDIRWDPCQLVPCWIDFLDPWIIYDKIKPEEFLSFRDKLDLKIDPEQGAVPFALNERVLGLQFYSKNRMMDLKERNGGVFTLKQDLQLDEENARSLGLKGTLVKAGEYPVIVNPENETFNVILSLEKGK